MRSGTALTAALAAMALALPGPAPGSAPIAPRPSGIETSRSGGSPSDLPPTARSCAFACAESADAPPLRRPRDRHYDVVHYRLTIDADLRAKRVAGEAEITLTPLDRYFDEVRLDAEAMTVSRVRASGRPLEFEHDGGTLSVALGRPYGPGDTITVSVDYAVTSPPKGLYFSGPDRAEPGRPWQLYSQGEPEENRYWFPCYDFPNDRATSEVIVTVDTPFTAVSNGRLVGSSRDAAGARTTWHWRQSIPHVSYLVSIAVGEFARIEDAAGPVPIVHYVRPEDTARAVRSFARTAEMMELFADITGRAYPWEKYGHVTVRDFIHLGQENVSISTLDDGTLHDARAALDRSSDDLVAHELAHQWFGNLVSFRDWSEAWLSEGFASYLTLLSTERFEGPEEFSYALLEAQETAAAADAGDRRRPTVTRRYGHPGELFDHRIYAKGACVLHMLRKEVGDSLFFRGLRAYVRDHQFRSVETSQFRLAMEEATGRNLDWFFEQWVHGAGYPEFEIAQRWDESSRTLRLEVRQAQRCDSLTGIFRVPVEILVWVGDDPDVYVERITDTLHVFSYPAYREPKLVIFDRGGSILKRARFGKPIAQWIEQLRSADHAADRVDAVAELRWVVDSPAVRPALLEALLRDRFRGVRYEAALALADSKAPIGAELAAAYGDRDARVRGAVVRALGNVGGEDAVRVLRHAFVADSSYVTAANAVVALGRTDPDNAAAVCLEAMSRESDNDAVRLAGMRTLAALPGVEWARDTITACAAPGRPRDVRVLAVSLLGRHWPDAGGLEIAASLLADPSFHVRRAAIDVLGGGGEEEFLGPLRRRLADEPDRRLVENIREAIRTIEAQND